MAHHSLCSFSFSLLLSITSSKTEYMEILDLISKLSSSLLLPKQATTTDETEVVENMPEWVTKLATNKGASFAWKVMEKQINDSDASDQQNCFMIRKKITEDLIMSVMTTEEITVANLRSVSNFMTSKRWRFYDGDGEAGERKHGREHGGLEVMVYNINGWGCLLYLMRWDASKAYVLKGRNYRSFIIGVTPKSI